METIKHTLGPASWVATLLLVACARDTAAPPGDDAHTPPNNDGGSTDPDEADAAAPDAGGAPDASPSLDGATGPRMYIHVRTNTAPYPHADGYRGQTSRDAYQGIRTLELLRGPDDLEPLVLLDRGGDYVEAGYNDGDDTMVGSVRLSDLTAGHYTLARSVVTHARYRVDATMHALGLALPGEFDNVQALSDGTRIEDVTRPQGWFRYIFRGGGMDYPREGMGAPLPTEGTTPGGFRLSLEGGVAAYYYPVDITFGSGSTEDLTLILEVNMFEAFRWEDQDLPGYTVGVFDSSPTASEPVRHFGANRIDMYVE